MFKCILKMFIPGDKKLAMYAADGIQKAINESKYTDQIAKYGDLADKATAIQKQLTTLLADGKIDDLEKQEIADMIQPLMKKLVELI